MNIILAVNSKQIEKYISNLKEINVLKTLKNKKNLKEDVIALNPHVIIISNYLPGEENMEEILTRLVNDSDFKARIIYLYGDDNLLRKKFTNNLIDLGIYDFYCGDIDEDVINMLLFNPKTKNTVKKEDISEEEENIINQVIQRKHNFVKEDHSSDSIDKYFNNTKVSPGDTFYSDNNLFEFEEDKELTVHFIEKIEEVQKIVEVEKVVEKTVFKTKTIRQQIITVYTTDDNTIKDFVISNLAVLLAKKSEHSILVIDMNMPTPSLDHHFGVTKEVYVQDVYNENKILTGLSACYSAILKNIFSTELLKVFAKEVKGFKNLDILTGLYDVDTFTKMGENDFIKIIDTAAQLYDTILIAVNPFLSCTATLTSILRANKVLVTCNANYTNARNSLFIVRDELINYHKLPKEKFDVVVTNMSNLSLDRDTMIKVFEGFNILGYIPENKYYTKSLNSKKPLLLNSYGKKDLISYLDIISNLGYIPKMSLIDKLFNKKKVIEANSSSVGE